LCCSKLASLWGKGPGKSRGKEAGTEGEKRNRERRPKTPEKSFKKGFPNCKRATLHRRGEKGNGGARRKISRKKSSILYWKRKIRPGGKGKANDAKGEEEHSKEGGGVVRPGHKNGLWQSNWRSKGWGTLQLRGETRGESVGEGNDLAFTLGVALREKIKNSWGDAQGGHKSARNLLGTWGERVKGGRPKCCLMPQKKKLRG